MDGYFRYEHHPLYENLTMEEKLLVDIEMKKWWATTMDLCVPTFLIRETERRIIENIKRKEKKWEIN